MNDTEDKGPKGPRKSRPGRAERAAAKAAGGPAGEESRAPARKSFDKDFRRGPRPAPGPGERRGGGKPPEFDSRRRDPRRVKEDLPEPGKERIARRLARAGIASRRDAEALIAAGRVRVNGTVLASPAFNVAADDRIEVDGTEIPPVERTRLFLFHKPAGVVTTNRDPEGRRTVFDILPQDLPRVVTVGRLDINTEGLLLLTNDGGLSRVLELPSTGWLRRYRVRVHGEVDEKALAGLKDGIAVDGVFYGSIEAALDRSQGTNAWLTIGLREGKNREVKNVLGALGLEVTRLIRISFGPFQLGELPEGAVLELKGRTLRDQLGERLIEEAGANFEAPIVNTFSNKPVLREREDRDERPQREPFGARRDPVAPRRDQGAPRRDQPGPVGEGGLIKNRKRDREDKRENALSRLGTRPPRGGFAGKKRSREEDAPAGPQERRRANVWMAPGARPKGKKDAEATPARSSPSKGRPEGAAEAQRPRWKDKPREQGDARAKRWTEKPGEQGERPRWRDNPREQGDPPAKRWTDRPRAEGDRPRFKDKPRAQGEGQRTSWKDKPPRKPGGDRPSSSRPGFGPKRSPRPDGGGRPAGGGPRGKSGGGKGRGGSADRRR